MTAGDTVSLARYAAGMRGTVVEVVVVVVVVFYCRRCCATAVRAAVAAAAAAVFAGVFGCPANYSFCLGHM